MDFDKLRSLLPRDKDELDSIEAMVEAEKLPPLLCVSGAFSTGKTSLVNRMIEKDLLPVALEESTCLPTFLEYAEKPAYTLVMGDSATPVSEEIFEETIKSPPEGARFLDVGLPLNWLAGLRLVDLPGTGGSDKIKAEYARQVAREADAIIYLLHPRGPSKEDMENLKLARAMAKKILVCVARWDIVRESVKSGEKAPDLEEWRKEIADAAGLDAPIIPLDKFGLGLPEIFAFLLDSVSSINEVRENRIRAELMPLVTNGVAAKKKALELIGAAGEEEKINLRSRLLAEKESLLKARGRAFAEKNAAITAIMEKWRAFAEKTQNNLAARLNELDKNAVNPRESDKFLNEGRDILNNYLTEAAREGSVLSQEYGKIDVAFSLPDTADFILPTPPALEIADFLDSGRFGALRDELEELKEKENRLNETPPSPSTDKEREECLEKIRRLEEARREILDQAPPMRETRIPANNGGKILGRMIGEIADLALIFFAPVTIATKTANIAAKTAKGLGAGAKVAKNVGAMAKETVKMAQTAHKVAKGEDVLPPPIIEKLGILDKFTLGYWGERVGEILAGGSAVTETVIDEDAAREREEILRSLESDLTKKRLELLAFSSSQSDNSAAREELREKIRRKEEDLRRARTEAEKARTSAAIRAEEDYLKKYAFVKRNAIARWTRAYEKQTLNMGALLRELLSDWWEKRVPQLLETQEARVNDLLAKTKESPANRQKEEEKLRGEIGDLEKIYASLRERPGDVS